MYMEIYLNTFFQNVIQIHIGTIYTCIENSNDNIH